MLLAHVYVWSQSDAHYAHEGERFIMRVIRFMRGIRFMRVIKFMKDIRVSGPRPGHCSCACFRKTPEPPMYRVDVCVLMCV